MNTSWPPNPRDAKHRQPVRAWNLVPMTLMLIGVCLLVGLRTQLGKNSEQADALYFRSQADRARLIESYQSLTNDLRALHEDSDAEQVTPQMVTLAKQITEVAEELMASNTAGNAWTDIRKGQVWRLITPMFLHFGPLHLAFNLYWLWMLGALLEGRYRAMRFLLLVVGIAVVSNTAQALISGTNFGGMSGVNYGLFGFILMHGRFHPAPSFRLDKQTIFIMLVWLVVCFTGALGAVANWAHAAGLLAGAGVGFTHAMIAGGGKLIHRQSQFKRAVAATRTASLHQCATCGITEKDDSDAEFRVHQDGLEYCLSHLPEPPDR